MRPNIALAQVELRRTVLVAEFQSMDDRWKVVLGGSLAGGGVATGGAAALPPGAPFLLALAAVAGFAAIAAWLRLNELHRGFRQAAANLYRDLETLKREASP